MFGSILVGVSSLVWKLQLFVVWEAETRWVRSTNSMENVFLYYFRTCLTLMKPAASRFVFTRACQWFLSRMKLIHSIFFHTISLILILMLCVHLLLNLPSGFFPSRTLTYCKYRVFQKEIYNGIANITVWRVL
jgi:hypothetical protein